VFAILISFLALQRIGELLLAERNRRWARTRGGVEFGTGHYPVVVLIHVLFYVSLVVEWLLGPRSWSDLWPVWLGLLIASQILRAWVILSLGRFWNTRIIVIPGENPVARGPYRFVRHPNYVVVMAEMLAIPMLCGAYFTAGIFSLANAWILSRRIPEEERALEKASGRPLPKLPRFLPRLPQ
jgi:methyltransferase